MKFLDDTRDYRAKKMNVLMQKSLDANTDVDTAENESRKDPEK